jgi:glycerol uptake facilitator-like aquaporin
MFPSRRVVPYLIAQLAGAIVAWLLLLAFGGPVNNLGATSVDTQRLTYAGAFMFEAFGTCFLCSVVLHTAVRSPSRLAPAAIGMTITLCILGFGVVTGGSINPARTIGPAVAAGFYREVPLYVAAQLVGAIFACGMYRWFWKQPDPLVTVPAPGGVTAE